ncbi:MAG: hypothetical protein ACOC02_05005 [Guyparkeria sp.]|uniref:hypothetical protein n=1 Tax=Guyparkeria sp. TaxID=2035736 RepID=UPI00397DF294
MPAPLPDRNDGRRAPGRPGPALLATLLLVSLGFQTIDATRPKHEPRPPTVYETNETKVTRHEHA